MDSNHIFSKTEIWTKERLGWVITSEIQVQKVSFVSNNVLIRSKKFKKSIQFSILGEFLGYFCGLILTRHGMDIEFVKNMPNILKYILSIFL